MSCALASPKDGVCANRRPVRERPAPSPAPVADAPALPGSVRRTPQDLPQFAAHAPFSESAPEATFSLTTLAERRSAGPRYEPLELEQPVRAAAPPSFREIRAGRAAAAARVPVAEVRIPLHELDPAQLRMPITASTDLDQLVERVRRRTAERLARATR